MRDRLAQIRAQITAQTTATLQHGTENADGLFTETDNQVEIEFQESKNPEELVVCIDSNAVDGNGISVSLEDHKGELRVKYAFGEYTKSTLTTWNKDKSIEKCKYMLSEHGYSSKNMKDKNIFPGRVGNVAMNMCDLGENPKKIKKQIKKDIYDGKIKIMFTLGKLSWIMVDTNAEKEEEKEEKEEEQEEKEEEKEEKEEEKEENGKKKGVVIAVFIRLKKIIILNSNNNLIPSLPNHLKDFVKVFRSKLKNEKVLIPLYLNLDNTQVNQNWKVQSEFGCDVEDPNNPIIVNPAEVEYKKKGKVKCFHLRKLLIQHIKEYIKTKKNKEILIEILKKTNLNIAIRNLILNLTY